MLDRALHTRFLRWCAVAWLGLLVSITSLASDNKAKPVFTPADFGRTDSSLYETLSLPADRETGTYEFALICQAIIGTNDLARDSHCIAPDGRDSWTKATLTAINKSVFEAATVDGQAVPVLMNFMVLFRCAEERSCKAYLIPNHGHNIREFGLAYSSPQPILESGEWYSNFADKLAWIASGRSFAEVGGAKFVVSALVGPLGASATASVEFAAEDHDYDSLAQSVGQSMQSFDYIPGFYLSQPTEMRIYEYWIDPAGKPAEAGPTSPLRRSHQSRRPPLRAASQSSSTSSRDRQRRQPAQPRE